MVNVCRSQPQAHSKTLSRRLPSTSRCSALAAPVRLSLTLVYCAPSCKRMEKAVARLLPRFSLMSLVAPAVSSLTLEGVVEVGPSRSASAAIYNFSYARGRGSLPAEVVVSIRCPI